MCVSERECAITHVTATSSYHHPYKCTVWQKKFFHTHSFGKRCTDSIQSPNNNKETTLVVLYLSSRKKKTFFVHYRIEFDFDGSLFFAFAPSDFVSVEQIAFFRSAHLRSCAVFSISFVSQDSSCVTFKSFGFGPVELRDKRIKRK